MGIVGTFLLTSSGIAGLFLLDGFSKYFEGWEMGRDDEE